MDLRNKSEIVIARIFETPGDCFKSFKSKLDKYNTSCKEYYEATLGNYIFVFAVMDDSLWNARHEFPDAKLLDREDPRFLRVSRICQIDEEIKHLEDVINSNEELDKDNKADETIIKSPHKNKVETKI